VFAADRFTLPFTVRTGVGADGVKKWTAAVQLAVAKYKDVSITHIHAIEHLRGY
jgi:hypothetical protein